MSVNISEQNLPAPEIYTIQGLSSFIKHPQPTETSYEAVSIYREPYFDNVCNLVAGLESLYPKSSDSLIEFVSKISEIQNDLCGSEVDIEHIWYEDQKLFSNLLKINNYPNSLFPVLEEFEKGSIIQTPYAALALFEPRDPYSHIYRRQGAIADLDYVAVLSPKPHADTPIYHTCIVGSNTYYVNSLPESINYKRVTFTKMCGGSDGTLITAYNL